MSKQRTVTKETRLACIAEVCSYAWLDVSRVKESLLRLSSYSDVALLSDTSRFEFLDNWSVDEGETDHEQNARSLQELEVKLEELGRQEGKLRTEQIALLIDMLHGYGKEHA